MMDLQQVRGRPVRQLPTYDSRSLRIPLLHEVGELIRYRSLVRNLVARDLKVRYKRSSIGFIWVMLNPLLTMLVLTIVFSQVFRFDVDHYSVYLLSGLLMWNLYAQGSNAAMSSLQSSGHVLRKLYVPPTAFIASAVGSALVNFTFTLVPLLALTLFNQVLPNPAWAFLIVPALLTTFFTFGVGLIVGALIVFFHDTFEIYQVFVQAYYFLTPIFYPVAKLPEPLRTMEQYNPMFLFKDMFWNALRFGTLPSLDQLLIATAVAVGTLLVGWIFFTRLEDKFAYHF